MKHSIRGAGGYRAGSQAALETKGRHLRGGRHAAGAAPIWLHCQDVGEGLLSYPAGGGGWPIQP